MGVKPAIFQSGDQASQHYLPGAYSRLDFIKGTGGLVSINNAVIFGDCRGGKPNTLLWFTGPAEAEEVLRDGPLLDAVKHAFRPGGGLVPQKIGAWRVNPGTQSQHEYKSGSTTMILARSRDYGLHTNQIKTMLEDGTNVGKKITIQFQNNPAEVWDNVEKDSFEIQYTGSGTTATMTITKTKLTTKVDSATDLDIDFSSFPTIQDLVNYINDQANYTATVKTSTPKDKTTELDSVTDQDIKTSAYVAKSNLQALIDVLNESTWVEASYNDSASSRLVPDNETSWVYFSGAVDGDYTSAEWINSLQLAEQEDIQFIGTSSEDASVHALIKDHCERMNSVTGKAERQFIVGGAAGETVEQVKTRAKNIASEAGMLAYPGFKHYDFNNTAKTKIWSPAYYAAKLLGAQVALAIAEPATNKDVDVLDWERNLSISDAEDLIKAGVCCGIKNRAGRFVNARTVTTYQGSELQKCEFSMMRIALFVSRDLRTAVEESFVGHAMSNSLLGKIDGIVIGKLSQYFDMGLFNGVPPYWGYKKTIIGDQVKIEYDCNLTPPTNFIFITSHMHVYASLAAA